MNKKIVGMVLCGLITVSTYVSGYANESKSVEGVKSETIQEKELNNTTAEAQKIDFDTKVVGSSPLKDEDWFMFEINNDANIEININTYNNQYNRALMGIYDSNINQVYLTKGLNDGVNKIFLKLNKGTYYINLGTKVSGWYDFDWRYDFKISRNYFSDAKGHWAESQINKFVDLGYVNGYHDNTFKPDNSITRAEFVRILNNKFGLTKLSGKVFNDTANHWARKDIDIAVTNGVCNGKSATEFKPDDLITREEAAVMVSNYKKISDKNNDKINLYYDSDKVSSWAKDSVEGVIEHGYMNGYDDNTFRPQNNITRAEAVSTLSRVK